MNRNARRSAPRVARRALLALMSLATVLALAACGGDGGGGAGDGGGLTFEATDFEFAPSEATAQAGQITVTMDNQAEQRHTWTVEGHEDALTLDADGGDDDTGTIELEAGTYTFYCDVPGHRDAGMEGTLTVEGS